ncbi:MAG: hypothetical protein K1Y02_09105 [Candidatus Hydrogenedentes bacterium]|nr:hypothetical protein [Candidatus Hydrogenedentota bacterium]
MIGCWRFVDGWLQHADPETGLIPRNLSKDFYWNAKDSAADNYPFMVLSTYFTNRPMFEGRMKDMLATEQRVCNRVDRLPDTYDFVTRTFLTPQPDMKDIIFGASEYAKDGLIPITELLGPSPWSDRMLAMLDDIWKNSIEQTESGAMPSTSHEVCGDLLQCYSRMYWMTGNDVYRQHVFALGDYFLLHHPPAQADELRLDDHGCEVVNGLSEAYYIASKTDPEKLKAWQPEMHRMLDRILEVGRDDTGLLFSLIDPKAGKVKSEDRTDNWGYNYNAFLVVAEVDKEEKYRDAVKFVLTNLPKNKEYLWENGGSDGYADSLEGGINLINRMPIPEAIEWAEFTAEKLLAKPRDTGVIEGWHGDGNFARTALMYALWKSQGTWLEPWRADLRLGAVRADDGTLYVVIESDWPWKGQLRFDKPRHSENLHMPWDYPRLNQFPEWFTATPNATFTIDSGILTGEQLRNGIPVSVTPEAPVRLRVQPKEGG